MTDDDFAALNAHLEEVRPIMAAFCARHGFVSVSKRALGRYPIIRIERQDRVNVWFDLRMSWDENGVRYDTFTPDRLYEMGAGACVDLVVGPWSGTRTRFGKSMCCFNGKPFHEVGAILDAQLEKHLPIIEAWDAEFLRKNGEGHRLSI